jgi:rhamnosyltransferase
MSAMATEIHEANGRSAKVRVVAYMHTFNAADIIEQTIEALQRQTRPLDAILLVDNDSRDGTLDRTFPENVVVIRNGANVGPSGAIPVGFRWALENKFDWIWVLDDDSAPEPEALAALLELYAGWPRQQQEETGFVSSLPLNQPESEPLHGRLITPYGRELITPAPDQRHYMCNVKVWSGCLFRLAAVRRVGFPNPDYFIDRGELEYAYRMMKAGYNGYIHQDSILIHNVRGTPGLVGKQFKVGPIALRFYELAPLRCYYTVRNTFYFTLYDMTETPFAKFRELFRLRSRAGRGFMSGIVWQASFLMLNFALRPRTKGPQLRACFRGVWDGVAGNVAARF